MIWDWLARQLGISKLKLEIDNLHDQKWQLEKLVGELTERVNQYRAESATRQRVMRDELMESEARLMTRIEELEDVETGPSDDTLPTEENKSGYIRWSERKRARAAAVTNVAALAERLRKNGDLPRSGRPAQDDVRRRNDQSGDGQGQAPEGEGKRD